MTSTAADTTAPPTVIRTDPKANSIHHRHGEIIIVKGTAGQNANGSGVAKVQVKTDAAEFYALADPKAQRYRSTRSITLTLNAQADYKR